MKSLHFIAILLLVCCTSAKEVSVAKKPQVFVLDLRALERSKARIQSDHPSVKAAFKQLRKDADKALKFGPVSVMEKKHIPPSGDKHDYMSLAPYHWPDPEKPDGLPYIRKDGQTNPEVKEYKDKEYMPELCDVVHTLALAYYFTEENHYAEHAATLIRTWFLDTATRMNPNLNFAQAMKGHNTGRGAGLIDTRHFIKVIDAIGLLQSSKYWKKDDQEGMKKWFGEFLHWMETSPNGKHEMATKNNHGAWYDAQRLSMALFIGDKNHAKDIVKSAQSRLDEQMNADGFFPKELERTISLHYSVFVMNAFFHIAQMSEDVGIDLWSYKTPSGKSLKMAFETLRPFLVQEKEWTGAQIKPFNFENGHMLLLEGEKQYGCRNCREAIRLQSGEKSERSIYNLLYQGTSQL